MNRHSPESERSIQGLKEFLETSDTGSVIKEVANDPAQLYMLNSSMEENDGRIRIVRQFDDDAIIDRCHTISSEVIENQQTMTEAIDRGVQDLKPNQMNAIFLPISKALETRPYRLPASVKQFLNTPNVKNSVKQYKQSRDATYKELFYWSREIDSMHPLLNFIKLLNDPVPARELLRKTAEPERNFYGLSTNIEAAMNSQAMHNTRVREVRALVDKYAADANRARLKQRLHGQNGLTKHLFIGALAIINFGASQEKGRMYADLRSLARKPQLPVQVLHDALHAQCSADT